MLVGILNRAASEFLDRIPSDRWDAYLSTNHAGYPLTKIFNNNSKDGAMTYGSRLSHNRLQILTQPSGADLTVDYLALLGLNRRTPTGPIGTAVVHLPNQVRLLIDSVLYPVEQPGVGVANFTLTNLTGAYSILNQPVNAPETPPVGYTPSRLSAVSHSANTVCSLRFDNLSGGTRPLATGTDVQEIQVAVRDSVFAGTFPTISSVLTEGGVDVQTLTEYEIERNDEGYIYKYRWNIPGSTQDIGVRVTGTTTGTSTPEPISVVWRAKVQNMEHEGEWQDMTRADRVGWFPAYTVPAGEIRRFVIEFSDFSQVSTTVVSKPGGGTAAVKVYSPLDRPFLYIGRLVAGPAMHLEIVSPNGMSRSSSVDAGSGLMRARMDITSPFLTREGLREIESWHQSVGETAGAEMTRGGGFRGRGFLPFPVFPFEDDPSEVFWMLVESFDAPHQGWFTGDGESGERWEVDFSLIEAEGTRQPTSRINR